jgi:hypothetical protein
MGYNMSKQKSLGFSPYYLLYGRFPDVPGVTRHVLEEPLDFDDEAVVTMMIRRRADLFKRLMPSAMNNLKTAQHRDRIRYRQRRSGQYVPKMRRYEVGDYVYLAREVDDTLQTELGRSVLQVKEVRPNDTYVLTGTDGKREVVEHLANLAPCLHPYIDSHARIIVGDPQNDVACEVCHMTDADDQERAMLLCERCGKGYHLFCLTPPLTSVPDGEWECPECRAT